MPECEASRRENGDGIDDAVNTGECDVPSRRKHEGESVARVHDAPSGRASAHDSEDPVVRDQASASASIARLAVDEDLVAPRRDTRDTEPNGPERDRQNTSAHSAEPDPRQPRRCPDGIGLTNSAAMAGIPLRRSQGGIISTDIPLAPRPMTTRPGLPADGLSRGGPTSACAVAQSTAESAPDKGNIRLTIRIRRSRPVKSVSSLSEISAFG